MKIKQVDKFKCDYTPLRALETGDTFLLEDVLFIKTDGVEMFGAFQCVALKTGEIFRLNGIAPCAKTEAKLKYKVIP